MKAYNDEEFEKLTDEVLKSEAMPASDFEERLSKDIDLWAAQESQKNRSYLLKWFCGVAAAIALFVSVLVVNIPTSSNQLADTYQDPEEAALAAQKAIALINNNLAKGMSGYYDTKKEIEKATNIINGFLLKEKNYEN